MLRRRLCLPAVVIALALLLAGCRATSSAPGSDGAAGAGPAAPSEPEEEARAFPVTIEHKFGSTEITESPERVVSLGFSDQDPLLALGVTPVAARYWYGAEDDVIFPWAEEAAGGVQPEVLNMPELNFEMIASLRPDLIIGTYAGMTDADYELLAAIAPTVAQSGDYIDYGMPWQEVTLTVGRAVGRSQQAEAMVAGVEAQFAAVRAAHPEFAGASLASVSGSTEGKYGFFASADPRARVFSSLDFDLPPEFDEIAGEQFYGDISAEQLDLFDRDVVVFQQIQFVEGGRAGLDADPFVQQLDAAGEGRIVYVDGTLDDALAFNSVLSLPFALETIVDLLAAALDGDPATEVPAA